VQGVPDNNEEAHPQRPRGLFAGLATLDIIHRVGAPPGPNEKITANAQFIAAGGPAVGAATAFAALGGEATLVTVLGTGQVAQMIKHDLASVNVRVVDIAPHLDGVAPVSSVIVTEETGDRAVVGGDAAGLIVPAPSSAELALLLHPVDVIVVDGHHPALARAVAEAASTAEIPSVLDAGHWKPVMADLIPLVTDIVASADFRIPGTASSEATARQLIRDGTPHVIATAGAEVVRWWSGNNSGTVSVPRVSVVDTLGAGDVFHGAYAFARARRMEIEHRIVFANRVASMRCATIGPRRWVSALTETQLN